MHPVYAYRILVELEEGICRLAIPSSDTSCTQPLWYLTTPLCDNLARMHISRSMEA